jgi:lipopolysaccharide/colanic/teichoic acid biosynthesis glycosyltransferase
MTTSTVDIDSMHETTRTVSTQPPHGRSTGYTGGHATGHATSHTGGRTGGVASARTAARDGSLGRSPWISGSPAVVGNGRTVRTGRPAPSSSPSCQEPLQRRIQVRNAAVVAARRLAANQPLVEPGGNSSRAYRVSKRAVDMVAALALLALLGPVMLLILIVLAVSTKGHPLYCSERIGYLGRRIKFWKFRTMRLDADQIRHTVANEQDGPVFKNRRDPRITWLGRWLRKTSLDETPQILSVLFGDMSLVGPRPLHVHEVARFAPWQRQRLAVKPGLTCLWQISGRSDVGFLDWARMDLWYKRQQSLWTDLWLVLKTPAAVLTGRGAY